MIRKANDVPVVLIASAAILLAVGSSAHARFASAGASPHAQMGNVTSHEAAPVRAPARPVYSYGWGYGRGWCYWHPYACYRNQNR